MPTPGYYRYPSVSKDSVVFTSEDDLWTVAAEGGVARRLTAIPRSDRSARDLADPEKFFVQFTLRNFVVNFSLRV